jgi:hypothetical protein
MMKQHEDHDSGVTRPKCPVCNTPVYSKAGIHPQCAASRQKAQQRAHELGKPPSRRNAPAESIEILEHAESLTEDAHEQT